MNINQELVRSRCQEIEDSLGRLERLGTMAEADFLEDGDAQDIACYRLLVAIEAALALCYHLVARRLHRVPEEYAECFALLAEAGLVPGDLSGSLQQMARFRNLLVHRYWKIDYRRIHRIIRDDLDDLRRFSRAVAALV